MLRKLLVVGFLGAGLSLSGCSLLYKVEVQQGNVVEQEMLSKLELGMPKEKVRFIMGAPMLIDSFHKDRWDYFYSLRKGGEEVEKRHVVLFFEGDRLKEIGGDAPASLPGKAPAPAGGETPPPL